MMLFYFRIYKVLTPIIERVERSVGRNDTFRPTGKLCPFGCINCYKCCTQNVYFRIQREVKYFEFCNTFYRVNKL